MDGDQGAAEVAKQKIGVIAGDIEVAGQRLADQLRADIPPAANSCLTVAETYLADLAKAPDGPSAAKAGHMFNIFAGLFHLMAGSSPAKAPQAHEALMAAMTQPGQPAPVLPPHIAG